MRGDDRPRSPYGDRADSRARGHSRQRDDYSRSRQGYSRSPDRQGSRYDSRERDDGYRDMDYSYGSSRTGPGRKPRDMHDFSGMYDDNPEYYQEEKYPRGRRGGYDDRDDPGYRSPPRRPRTRSHSHSPVRDAGRPSDTVILEGLPQAISSSELQESILRNSAAADLPPFDVRISSSRGNRRAFVQFDSVDSSIFFTREHFPKLPLDLPHPTDEVPDGWFNVYIHYARNREDADTRGHGGGNWTCQECDFPNYASRTRCKMCGGPPPDPDWKQSLTGFADAANVPSQILVVYPLPAFINEDMLAGDMKRLELGRPNPNKDSSGGAPKLKSTAPTGDAAGYGARPGSVHRVFLMRDAYNDESLKYGFVEFWTLEDAAAAMAKIRASSTFTVASCPVNVSTIHMGVFLPEEREVTPDIERMSFHPLFNPSLRVRYKDLRVYPSSKVVTPHPPTTDEPAKADAANEAAKKSKKRKADGAPASTAVAKKPVAMAGQMAVWQRKHDELHQGGASKGASDDGQLESEPRGDQSNAPIKISLSNAKIGGLSTLSDAPKSSASPEKPGAESQEALRKSETPTRDTGAVSYVDRDRLMCLICMRKYKSVDEVNIHEKSRNHKQATEKEDLVKAALPRLAARDKRLQKQTTPGDGEDGASGTTDSQYRDRAKERRQTYSQAKKPATAPPKAADKPPRKEDAPPKPKPAQPSKGAGMLAKMGWAAGGGLGANGEGRTEAVPAHAYQEGVGLGAEGGNLGDAAELAGRKTTNSYADYVNTVQDKARERYNKM